MPAEVSRRALAVPTTAAAVFTASAAKERKNCRRARRFASSGSAGPAFATSVGADAAGSDAGRRSSVTDRPRPGPRQ